MAAGALAGYLNPRSPWFSLLAIFLLLPVRAFVDESIHLNLHGYVYDRNMLPFEIIYFQFTVLVPLILGSELGRRMPRRKSDAESRQGAA